MLIEYFESASQIWSDNKNNVETFIKLASLLSGLPNDVRIEGHTDSGLIIPGSITEEKFGELGTFFLQGLWLCWKKYLKMIRLKIRQK